MGDNSLKKTGSIYDPYLLKDDEYVMKNRRNSLVPHKSEVLASSEGDLTTSDSNADRYSVTQRSLIVDELIPEGLRDSSTELFQKLLEYYYEYLASDNMSDDIIGSLYNIRNSDTRDPNTLQYLFEEFASIIPFGKLKEDPSTFIKNITSFYKQKGDVESIKSFFRVFFNDSSANVVYPWENILIASGGQWKTEYAFVIEAYSDISEEDFVEITEEIRKQSGLYFSLELFHRSNNHLSTANKIDYSSIEIVTEYQKYSDESPTETGTTAFIVKTSFDLEKLIKIDDTIEIRHIEEKSKRFFFKVLPSVKSVELDNEAIHSIYERVIDKGETDIFWRKDQIFVINGTHKDTIVKVVELDNETGFPTKFETLQVGYSHNVDDLYLISKIPYNQDKYDTQRNIGAVYSLQFDPDSDIRRDGDILISQKKFIRRILSKDTFVEYDEESDAIDDASDAFIENSFVVKLNVAGCIKTKALYQDSSSLLSTSRANLQDSFYYQRFSYDVRSEIHYEDYDPLLEKLVHPAGLKRFVTYFIPSYADLFIHGKIDDSTGLEYKQENSLLDTLELSTDDLRHDFDKARFSDSSTEDSLVKDVIKDGLLSLVDFCIDGKSDSVNNLQLHSDTLWIRGSSAEKTVDTVYERTERTLELGEDCRNNSWTLSADADHGVNERVLASHDDRFASSAGRVHYTSDLDSRTSSFFSPYADNTSIRADSIINDTVDTNLLIVGNTNDITYDLIDNAYQFEPVKPKRLTTYGVGNRKFPTTTSHGHILKPLDSGKAVEEIFKDIVFGDWNDTSSVTDESSLDSILRKTDTNTSTVDHIYTVFHAQREFDDEISEVEDLLVKDVVRDNIVSEITDFYSDGLRVDDTLIQKSDTDLLYASASGLNTVDSLYETKIITLGTEGDNRAWSFTADASHIDSTTVDASHQGRFSAGSREYTADLNSQTSSFFSPYADNTSFLADSNEATIDSLLLRIGNTNRESYELIDEQYRYEPVQPRKLVNHRDGNRQFPQTTTHGYILKFFDAKKAVDCCNSAIEVDTEFGSFTNYNTASDELNWSLGLNNNETPRIEDHVYMSFIVKREFIEESVIEDLLVKDTVRDNIVSEITDFYSDGMEVADEAIPLHSDSDMLFSSGEVATVDSIQYSKVVLLGTEGNNKSWSFTADASHIDSITVDSDQQQRFSAGSDQYTVDLNSQEKTALSPFADTTGVRVDSDIETIDLKALFVSNPTTETYELIDEKYEFESVPPKRIKYNPKPSQVYKAHHIKILDSCSANSNARAGFNFFYTVDDMFAVNDDIHKNKGISINDTNEGVIDSFDRTLESNININDNVLTNGSSTPYYLGEYVNEEYVELKYVPEGIDIRFDANRTFVDTPNADENLSSDSELSLLSDASADDSSKNIDTTLSVSDTNTTSDVFDSLLFRKIVVNDNAATTDSINRVFDANRVVSDTSTTDDSFDRTFTADRVVSDTSTTNDLLDRTFVSEQVINDSITSSDQTGINTGINLSDSSESVETQTYMNDSYFEDEYVSHVEVNHRTPSP